MNTPDMEKFRLITSWLRGLAQLTRSERADEEAIALMGAMLAIDFAADIFNQRSLHHVVRQMAHWPAYAELAKLLREWLADHAPPALPPPVDGHSLSALDRHWLGYWKQRAPERDSRGRARLASLIRQQAPKAWAMIAKSAPEAMS